MFNKSMIITTLAVLALSTGACTRSGDRAHTTTTDTQSTSTTTNSTTGTVGTAPAPVQDSTVHNDATTGAMGSTTSMDSHTGNSESGVTGSTTTIDSATTSETKDKDPNGTYRSKPMDSGMPQNTNPNPAAH